jgi:DNA-binding NarL/FixJ family response regulator
VDEISKSRILLVDDHELVRKGLRLLLETSWEICGEAANGEEAVGKVQELRPDLVVLDLGMPVMGGTVAARGIRTVAPETKILILTMHESESFEHLSKFVRIDGYLTKSSSPETLRKTITSILSKTL